MSQSPEDSLAQARERFLAANAQRSAFRSELDALRTAGGAEAAGTAVARIGELEALLPALERAWAEAHTAFGRAMLDQFERDLNKLAYPNHDPEAARELRLMADNLRRACLAVLSDWPELQEEARGRLRPPPPPPGPGTLHG